MRKDLAAAEDVGFGSFFKDGGIVGGLAAGADFLATRRVSWLLLLLLAGSSSRRSPEGEKLASTRSQSLASRRAFSSSFPQKEK